MFCLHKLLDSTAPRISITSPLDPSSSSPTIEWKSTEPVKFSCTFDDGQATDCGDGTTGSWTGRNVPDGSRKLVIEGKDIVGNFGRFIYSWIKGMMIVKTIQGDIIEIANVSLGLLL